MAEVKDLSNLGKNKDGKKLDLKLPAVDNPKRPLTLQEFVSYSVHNFDQVAKKLLEITTTLKNHQEFLLGQNGVNQVYEQRLKSIEKILDVWMKEIKKFEKNELAKTKKEPVGTDGKGSR